MRDVSGTSEKGETDRNTHISTSRIDSESWNTIGLRSLVFVLLTVVLAVSIAYSAPASKNTDFGWFNTTWEHRVGLNITADGEVKRWPVERTYNFTALLRNQSDDGDFDNNSIRVYEYNKTGHRLWEVPSQFDKGENYNKSTNAHGELIFKMNGTTSPGETRYFFVYFDSIGSSTKQAPEYASNISYAANGEQFTVNTTKMNYTIDTKRGNYTSGMSFIEEREGLCQDCGNVIMETGNENNKTAEYIEYTNGTHRFTFNLTRNYTVTRGPLRLSVTQKGYQTYYGQNRENETLFVTKTYQFYSFAGEDYAGFFKVEQNVENRGDTAFGLEATPAGALVQDINRTMRGSRPLVSDEDNTDPFSYSFARGQFSTVFSGAVNINESIDQFFADAVSPRDRLRVGINLSQVSLASDSSFSQETFISPGTFNAIENGINEFFNQKDMFLNSPTINQFNPETINATVEASTNETVFNRDETIQVIANLTSNPYNETRIVNATLDRNTSTETDDDTITLSFNGSDTWTGNYSLTDTSNLGTWQVNISVYTEDKLRLDHSTSTFNVTDIFNTNVTIDNDVEVAGLPIYANTTVNNIRRDRNITGATLNCEYGGETVDQSNISAFNPSLYPGLYSLNFTGPSPAGEYTMSCNATNAGNLGKDSDDFRTEVAKVVPNVSFIPQNATLETITLGKGENTSFVVNVTNFADGTASSSNLSLSLPSNWTANTTNVECGDLTPDSFCQTPIQASVPNASFSRIDNYSINHTLEWDNPDGTDNSSLNQFTVEITENPILDVFENQVNGTVGGGQKEPIDNFTIRSLGNYNLTDVNVTCPVGTACNDFNISFAPSNFSTLEESRNRTITGNVSVPKRYQPGNYTGTINASTNKTFDTLTVEINVINDTSVSTETLADQIVFNSITQRLNQTQNFTVRNNNTGRTFAFAVNNTISLPGNLATNESVIEVGDMDVNQSNNSRFYVTVPNSTGPGNETVDVEARWMNPDGTYDTSIDSLIAWIQENPLQNVTDRFLNGTVPAGEEVPVGNITVESIGNYNITNVSFTCKNGTGDVCRNFTTTFEPTNISTLDDGANRTVDFNVSVPAQYPAGSYEGELNISSDGGYDMVGVNVSVPITRSWTLTTDQETDNECVTSSSPVNGTVCIPTINNTGNTDFNLSIDPTSANSTEPDQVNYSLPFEGDVSFNMTYNVSDDPGKVYEATYNISSDKDASPKWQYLNISVIPAVPPDISVNLTPETIEQNDTVRLVANTSSNTPFDIANVNATVTSPFNTTVNASLSEVEQAVNSSRWALFYPNDTIDPEANTTVLGNYTVNFTAQDGLGNTGTNASNFSVTRKLVQTVQTLKEFNNQTSIYEQGDTGTIYYKLADVFGDGLADARVNLTITSSNLPFSKRITTSGKDTFVTQDNGVPAEAPAFEINDDFPVGLYSIFSNMTWEDDELNRTERRDSVSTFSVGKEGNIEPYWDVGEVWYPGTNLTARVATTSDGTALRDVDGLNMTIYTPDQQEFMTFNKSNFTKEGTGSYRLEETIPDDAELGIYWVKLSIEDDGVKTVRFNSFRMTSQEVATGPFDIRANLLENTVKQDDYLDFNLTLINMGNNSGDSKVTYWVSKDGTQYAYTSETVYTPANSELEIARNIFIFSNQPPGDYQFNAEVEPLDSSLTPAVTNVTFKVKQKNETEEEREVIEESTTETREITREPESEPAENDTEPGPQPNITIIDAPRIMNVASGKSGYRSVTVANTGDVDLNNLTMFMTGLRPSWYNVTPRKIRDYPQDSSEVFTLRLDVPDDTEGQSLNTTILASADQAHDRHEMTINIFESLESKVQADIEYLQEQLRQLEQRMESLADDGIDTSGVQTIFEDIELRLDEANSSLAAGNTSESLDEIAAAERLITDANEAMNTLREKERQQEDAYNLVPIIGGVLGTILLALGILYLIKVRNFNPLGAVKKRFRTMTLHLRKKRKKKQQELKEKKEKATRLINLLEAQHEEGIMDDETYEEMRASAEDRLKSINEKLDN